MSNNNISDALSRAGNQLLESTADAIAEAKRRHEEDLKDEGYEDGRRYQKAIDSKAAIDAFLELRVKDQDIFRLLSEHFGIDSISEASALLKKAKINRQIIALRKYCESSGMSAGKFREYADSFKLEEKLTNDERLLDMQPDKLKAAIERY